MGLRNKFIASVEQTGWFGPGAAAVASMRAELLTDLDAARKERDALRREVQRWQQLHRFVPPGHFYSPMPAVADIERDAARLFPAPPPRTLPGIDLREAAQLRWLEECRSLYAEMPFVAEPQGRVAVWLRERRLLLFRRDRAVFHAAAAAAETGDRGGVGAFIVRDARYRCAVPRWSDRHGVRRAVSGVAAIAIGARGCGADHDRAGAAARRAGRAIRELGRKRHPVHRFDACGQDRQRCLWRCLPIFCRR